MFEQARYSELPDDWVLLISDVEGSTLAVKAGKYRAVNLVGAACIIAVVNVAAGRMIPYAFGGDGALIAVPPELVADARTALLAVARLSSDQYGLKLRVGAVPVRTLHEAGHHASVAKFRLAGDDVLAMFWGEGLGIAEGWVKAPNSEFLYEAGAGEIPADLTGLSCRWEPFRPEQGKILALLVKSRTSDEAATYRQIFQEVMRLAGGEQPAANPVKLGQLKKNRLLPSTFGLEQRLHAHAPPWRRLWARLQSLIDNVVGNLLFMTNLKTPVMDPEAYLSSSVARSDFRKFDGMLRMVVEVPDTSRAAIETLLETHRGRGTLFYGVHWSEDAVMTCALFSLSENRHVHFIDGGDGGYAFAAIGLKAQIAAAGSR